MLSVNTEPNEDDAVLPLMNNGGYTFIPLKSPYAGWDHDNFEISAVPVNLLLDQQGRIFFRADLEGTQNRQYFEQALEALLQKGVEPTTEGRTSTSLNADRYSGTPAARAKGGEESLP